jgi:hypothetical protein
MFTILKETQESKVMALGDCIKKHVFLPNDNIIVEDLVELYRLLFESPCDQLPYCLDGTFKKI